MQVYIYIGHRCMFLDTAWKFKMDTWMPHTQHYGLEIEAPLWPCWAYLAYEHTNVGYVNIHTQLNKTWLWWVPLFKIERHMNLQGPEICREWQGHCWGRWAMRKRKDWWRDLISKILFATFGWNRFDVNPYSNMYLFYIHISWLYYIIIIKIYSQELHGLGFHGVFFFGRSDWLRRIFSLRLDATTRRAPRVAHFSGRPKTAQIFCCREPKIRGVLWFDSDCSIRSPHDVMMSYLGNLID